MKILIAFVLLIFNINYCWALRCNGQLVYEGDKQKIVLSKCGEPQAKKTLSTTQALYNEEGVKFGFAPFLTEVWTYHKSPQDFVYKVYFTNKVVTSITANLPSP
ncbi:DUF2845 domain-containing protein [Legionella oakridgensis]|uniref:DUF2845 domain-containing protein n=2 Tax=Legionella oakridgensis TaxID=29423 RepID=W0BB75_9GAMM|nr:DUF2845 domain-containing protein [Legionella oakridgensis]AHE65862.1 hypothetical protein Loa_00273 [Legionella oakridgensis ATCC 33761 = DSM 21215]ETO94387.1 hypothetical protein LOR_19c01720 [Legionella oakridgensis RV-2-2007]KTD37293.1 hypothetical protein Loak_2429 [Legionella oakridgensis]STY15796.1 Protein of uncharacterised function (DUF2845) [Legionella longbeachae]